MGALTTKLAVFLGVSVRATKLVLLQFGPPNKKGYHSEPGAEGGTEAIGLSPEEEQGLGHHLGAESCPPTSFEVPDSNPRPVSTTIVTKTAGLRSVVLWKKGPPGMGRTGLVVLGKLSE